MPKIKLFIATSLDGFIARENDSLDWLNEIPNPNQLDYGYEAFLSTIDIVIMGRRTYEEILGFGVEWPYSQCKTYIVTSNTGFQTPTENTGILNNIDEHSVAKLKKESKKNLWIVGGGKLITAFLNQDAIDEMLISIVPVLLGSGIKLFQGTDKETKLELIDVQSFETGLVNLRYKRKL